MKLDQLGNRGLLVVSRPSRGAWIETVEQWELTREPDVAPFTGRVD